MERRRVRFTGRVQGVGFRATTRSVAQGFDVSGWVRNEPDGSVLAEIQGPAGEIDLCLAALRQRMGRFITGEDASTIPRREAEAGFRIDR